MEGSPSAIAPLLLRNLLTSLFYHADKSLIYLVDNVRFLRILRRLLVAAFLFFLRILPSLFPSLSPSAKPRSSPQHLTEDDAYPVSGAARYGGGGDSGIARALTQLLLIMNDIPVSSRKYEVVRSLAEKLIDGNLGENNQALRDVNCAVLSAAFARTLRQLEGASAEQGRRGGGEGGGDGGVAVGVNENGSYLYNGASRLARGVRSMGRVMWRYAKPGGEELSRSRSSAEKLAAELLWLAQKMAASGCASEAVRKWASASRLSGLATTAEPRLQGSLVKASAFLIKQAKEMRKKDEEEEDGELHEIRQTKMKMLMSWLPLLCRANNGTDAPIITMSERAELERVMEDIIWELDEEEEQERVLSVWLHHFTYCSASDWPNLRSCYTHWFDAARTRLLQSLSRAT